MREQTFQVNGPKLFNSLPVKLRSMTKCPLDEFKLALDNYLSKIPDEPNVSGLTPGGCTAEARAFNSILDQSKRIPLTGHGMEGYIVLLYKLLENGYKVAALAMSLKIYT